MNISFNDFEFLVELPDSDALAIGPKDQAWSKDRIRIYGFFYSPHPRRAEMLQQARDMGRLGYLDAEKIIRAH